MYLTHVIVGPPPKKLSPTIIHEIFLQLDHFNIHARRLSVPSRLVQSQLLLCNGTYEHRYRENS